MIMNMNGKLQSDIFVTNTGQNLKLLTLEDFALFIKNFHVGDSVNVYLSIDEDTKEATNFIGVKLVSWNEETFYILGGFNNEISTISHLGAVMTDKELVELVIAAVTNYTATDIVGVHLPLGATWDEVWISDEITVPIRDDVNLDGGQSDSQIKEYLLKHNCCLLPIIDGGGNSSCFQETCDILGEETSCILCDRISLPGLRPDLPPQVEIKGKSKEETLVNVVKAELVAKIRSVVEGNGGCIGTWYKNIGIHHTKAGIEDEYDESPVVNIHNEEDYGTYGGYDAASVYDLFIDPITFKLLSTLNGEDGEDYDEDISLICVEGLLKIVKWLELNGFLN